jgi:hypothetical protein
MSPIRIVVAAALAAGAAMSAQALNISTYAGNAGTNINVYISGSTAVDATLLSTEILSVAPGGLCAANTIDVYQIGSPSQRMTYCSAAAGLTGITAGTPLAIFKESSLGSINGAAPLIAVAKGNASGVSFIDPAKLVAAGGDADCAAVVVVPATAKFSQYNNHTACAGAITTANIVPTGGVADVEANLLRTVPGGGALAPNDISTLISGQAGLDVVWGVAVTKNLYYALQAAEHLADGTKIAACAAANNDAPACAPSLSKSQVASLYEGTTLVAWNSIAGLNNGVDNNTYICRRDVGSGTEASFEAYFLGARCSSSSGVMAAQDGNFVFTSSSTGNVRACLQAISQGGTVTPFNGDFGTTFPPKTFTGAGRWAIGILSTEVKLSDLNAAGDSFRFIAVDGVLPTLENVVNGFWPYFSTDVFYQIAAGKPGAPTGGPLSAFNALNAKIGSPVLTGETNTAFAGVPWVNTGGDLAPAGQFAGSNPPTIPATAATVASNPTNAFSKTNSGSVNNCDTPVMVNSSLTTPAPSVHLGNGNVNN